MLEVEKILRKSGATNIYVATERFATIWGGSSLLEMFLASIRLTLNSEFFGSKEWSNWDYILNLSETDMPLLSIEELEYNLQKFFFY